MLNSFTINIVFQPRYLRSQATTNSNTTPDVVEVEWRRRQPAMHDWERDVRPHRQEQGQTRAVPLRDTREIYGEHLRGCARGFQSCDWNCWWVKRWDSEVKTSARYFGEPAAALPPVEWAASTVWSTKRQLNWLLDLSSSFTWDAGSMRKINGSKEIVPVYNK